MGFVTDGTAQAAQVCEHEGPRDETKGPSLIQSHLARVQRSLDGAVSSTDDGCMTMWSDNEDVITGSHCGYAASDYGGMDFLPATRSTYINSTPRRYCAI